MTCDKLIVVPQISATCWFNAILMALFFSENTKNLLIQREKEWEMSMRLKKIFRDILKRRSKSYDTKHLAYMFFKVITPEYILEQMHKEDPIKFNFDPSKRSGYFNTLYLPKLLEFLGVSNTLHLDAIENANGTYDLYYSNIYNNYRIMTVEDTREKKEQRYIKQYKMKAVEKNMYSSVDLVTIRFDKENHAKKNMFKKNVKLEDIIKEEVDINGQTYINDSLLLTNFNMEYCSKGHDIAGITCDGKRYMYNGWMRHTRDRSMGTGGGGGKVEEYPCEVMPYDWLTEQIDFCLNSKLCKLDSIKKEDLSRQVCFNVGKGERTYILVNKNLSEKQPRTIESKNILTGPAPAPKKTCPEGKIVNPKTGRCVKIDGAIGKKVSKMNLI